MLKIKNNFWEDYKEKYKKLWHYNPKLKSSDYKYLGNFKLDFKKIVKKLLIMKKANLGSEVVSDKPSSNSLKVQDKVKAFKKWGYNKENTKHIQLFSKDFPEEFKKIINITGLEKATASAVFQDPGHIIPWHYDAHVDFHRLTKENKELKNKTFRRYMFFVTDWDWGHYFAVGNNVIHQWKSGDLITWENHMHHCGSNSGMTPKITLNVTGICGINSLHLKKR